MKAFNFLCRFSTLSFVLRTMLIIALYVFSVTLSQAQISTSSSAIEQSKSNTGQQPQQSVINKNQNPEAKNLNVTSSPVKVAEHAPDPNDADYEIKKEEWIKKYPEEYKALLNNKQQNNPAIKPGSKSKISPDNLTIVPKTSENIPNSNNPDSYSKNGVGKKATTENSNSIVETSQKSQDNFGDKTIENGKTENTYLKRIGEHGPYINEENLDAKIQVWKYEYPEEYMEYRKNNPDPNVIQGSVIIPVAVTSSANCEKFNNKVAEHAPDFNDPDYETKKMEWIKNYPEEYNNLFRQNVTPVK